MSTHHRFSPSKLREYENCPGFTQDENQDTSAADEGTRLHTAIETGVTAGLDAEQIDVVDRCIRYVTPFRKFALFDLKEVKLKVTAPNGEVLTEGTGDELLGRDGPKGLHLDLFDWKTGRNPVDDAKINRQGWSYVVGAFDLYPTAVSCTMHFVLPRQHDAHKHTFFRSDIARLKLSIQKIIDTAKSFQRTRDPKLLNCTERCMYCGSRGSCPATTQLGITYAKAYAPLELVEEVHSSMVTDPAQAAKYLTVVRVLEKMIDSCKKHLVALGMQNGGLPGYTIAEKAGTRKISNIPAAFEVLKNYISPEEMLLESTTSLPGVLDRAAEKAPKGQKSKLRGKIESELAAADAVSYGEPTHYLKKSKD